jgi:putative redox protein
MGGELFLASIGGCFMSNLLAAIRARGAEVADVQTEVTASLEGAPACFSSIELRVFGECKDSELFEKLVEIAGRGCIMVNTLRGKLDLRITIAQRREIQAAG